MRLARLVWALTAVAPWCLATVVVVTLSARAEQEMLVGYSRLALPPSEAPEDLVPVPAERPGVGFELASDPVEGLVSPASFEVGGPDELAVVPDESEPKMSLKRHVTSFPEVDRRNKGSSLFGLRPGFESRLFAPGAFSRLRRSALLFAERDGDPLAASFEPSDLSGVGPEAVSTFAGAVADPTTTVHADGLSSPQVAFTARGGATPAVPRAIVLSSTTPQASDSLPVEVDAMLRLPGQAAGTKARPGAPNITLVARNGEITEQPDYLSLISSDKLAREQECLAQAIYFEARSEPEAGQAAVAQVVLNRVASGLFPASVCGVVYQNAQHYLGCQFSFACEGKSPRITEAAAWAVAQRIAREVIEGSTYTKAVGDAMNYHAKYVTPYWAHTLTKVDVIGQHIFYRSKQGQS